MAPSTTSQQIPSTPREAIQIIRDELGRLETQPWVRNYQAVGTASASSSTATQAVGQQAVQCIQNMGLGYTSLAAFAIEAATWTQQQQQR